MIILIISGKSGVGKTFTCANLGVIIAKAGFKTLLLDADIKLANLEILLGLEGKEITLQHVLNGEARLEDAIYNGPGGVDVIPAGLSIENITSDIKIPDSILSELIELYDYILVDPPAGLEAGTLVVIALIKRIDNSYKPGTNSVSRCNKDKNSGRKNRMQCKRGCCEHDRKNKRRIVKTNNRKSIGKNIGNNTL